MTADDLVTRELMFNRFQRLIAEVIRGETRRTVFQSWEVDLLIDIEACKLNPKRRVGTLGQYLRAVERQLDREPGPPMKLSEFLEQRRAASGRSAARRPPEDRDRRASITPGICGDG
jgi:hypothetical protein